jgi:hypothetical protein
LAGNEDDNNKIRRGREAKERKRKERRGRERIGEERKRKGSADG